MCTALSAGFTAYASMPAQPESESVVVVEENITEVAAPVAEIPCRQRTGK